MQETKTKLYRISRVTERCGYSRPSIYRLMAAGEFPRPVKLGARAVAWRSDDVEAWIESRAKVAA